jgi:hypothetical protein
MRYKEFISESPATDLAKRLPSLAKHDYNTIDKLMQNVAKKHGINGKALHDLFVKKFGRTPDTWVKGKLDELNTNEENVGVGRGEVSALRKLTPRHVPNQDELSEDSEPDLNNDPTMRKFIAWTTKKLNLDTTPKIEFSYDTEEAQEGHHTGRHVEGSNEVWVYAKNRNMVDIMRTVFHELVHCRQSELNMIQPGDSYPGSPIEAEADMMAGKYIKIFGKAHPQIFQ